MFIIKGFGASFCLNLHEDGSKLLRYAMNASEKNFLGEICDVLGLAR